MYRSLPPFGAPWAVPTTLVIPLVIALVRWGKGGDGLRLSPKPKRCFSLLLALLLPTLACSSPAPGQLEGVVVAAFDAAGRHDGATFQAQLDDDGRRHVLKHFCTGGVTLTCLGYEPDAQLISREARLLGSRWLAQLSEDDSGPQVLLKTVWSPARSAGRQTLCQRFHLKYNGRAKKGAITGYEQPRSCS
jgi:hypothetical protein